MHDGLVVLIALLGGIVIGLPIAFSLLLAGFLGLTMLLNVHVAIAALSTMPYAKLSEPGLVVIPLFILMGYLAARAGITDKAYEVANKWVGHYRGGIGMATILACAGFAATSGSSVATSAAVGRIALGEMKRAGYANFVSSGVVAGGGLLGIMIPPSIMLIVYGIVTETNIGMLLVAGIIPGLLTAFLFCGGLWLIALVRPDLMPTSGVRTPVLERITSIKDAWGILVLLLIIIGGIYSGFVTINEAAGLGAVSALIMAIIHRRGRLSEIFEDGMSTARVCAMIFLILIGAQLFSQYVALAGYASTLAGMATASGLDPYVILLFILLIYIPLGMFLEPISMCLLTLPIIFPIILALGFNPIWFGIIIVKMCELANITPPIGVNLFVIRGIDSTIPFRSVISGGFLFVIFELIVLFILILWPGLSLWLPGLMM